MTVLAAFRTGISRVNRAPLVLLGVITVTLLVAFPLSFALRGMIEAHLGRSLMANAVADGTSSDWWQEFSSQATGLGATFVPSIIGAGAVLDNLNGIAENLPLAPTIVGATAAWVILWAFLSGGIIDRFARDRATRAFGFFGACGAYFWRFTRLGAVAFLIYYLLFRYIHPWLLTDSYDRLTRDLTVERDTFFIRLALYAAFGLMLTFTSLVCDYARIRIVVEDRRSAVGAMASSLRFIRRRPGGTIALYLVNALAFIALVVFYTLAAPGAPRSGAAMWLGLALGQVYIVARHYLKLVFYASQTAYFQASLAHAAFTAPPAALWPESPAAEAITNRGPGAAFADAAPRQ